MVQMRNLAESFNEKSLPCVKGGGFAEQTRRDCNCKSKNTSLKVKVANDNPSVLLRSTAPFTQGSLFYISKFIEKFTITTHLWVASNNCMAGRPIKKRTCA